MNRAPAGQRNYNGLHLPIGAQAANQQERLQIAFAQQHQALAREIYVRAAADAMTISPDGDAYRAEDFRVLAEHCQIAATAYFEGAGLVRPKQEKSEQGQSDE